MLHLGDLEVADFERGEIEAKGGEGRGEELAEAFAEGGRLGVDGAGAGFGDGGADGALDGVLDGVIEVGGGEDGGERVGDAVLAEDGEAGGGAVGGEGGEVLEAERARADVDGEDAAVGGGPVGAGLEDAVDFAAEQANAALVGQEREAFGKGEDGAEDAVEQAQREGEKEEEDDSAYEGVLHVSIVRGWFADVERLWRFPGGQQAGYGEGDECSSDAGVSRSLAMGKLRGVSVLC